MVGMLPACPDYLNDYHFNNDYNTDCEFTNSKLSWTILLACVDVQQAHQATFKSFHQENMRELINSVEKRSWINLGTVSNLSIAILSQWFLKPGKCEPS